MLIKKKEKIPISRLLGIKYFWDYKFINTNVLDPRWDSELLVESCIEYCKKTKNTNISLLDLGTGSGCLILSVLKELEKLKINSCGFGIDISHKAIKTAEKNRKNLNVNNCCFIEGNWWNFKLQKEVKNFDFVLCNPPYISYSEKQYVFAPGDPDNSLFAEQEGMKDYISIIENTPKYIKSIFFFEVSDFNCYKVVSLLNNFSWTILDIKKDIENRYRCIICQK